MAKWNIKHSCGHIAEHQLYGKSSLREWKAKRLEEEPCWECEKARRAEAAAKATEERGLPSLEGTEKQVAWANTIRVERLDRVRRYVEEESQRVVRQMNSAVAAGVTTQEQAEAKIVAYVAKLERALVAMEQEVSAKWWIEWRSADLQTTINHLDRRTS